MNPKKTTNSVAVTYKPLGNGRDETRRMQAILNELAHTRSPAVLQLEQGKAYLVKSLNAPHGITIDGQGASIHGITRGNQYVFNISGRANVTLQNLVIHAAYPIQASEHGVCRLKNVALEPSIDDAGQAVSLLFSDHAVLHARNVNALHLSNPKYPATFQDDARVDWRGGAIMTDGLCFLDRAGGKLMPDRLLGTESSHSKLILGRPAGGLFAGLCGTAQNFKKILGNPRYAKKLAAWKKHNATQTGRLYIQAGGSAPEAWTRGLLVQVNGSYRLDAINTHFKVLDAFDQTHVRMRGGSLVRLEAHGLSDSRYVGVNLTAPGRDDPWHPTTTYLQGYHNMEFSRGYNDLLPRVEFRDGVIDFAGDDCLNGLPETRAMQLMEIVHDHRSLFPSFEKLRACAPEQIRPGARIAGLAGAIGALHDEATKPRLPYDFRQYGFTWRGAYDADAAYRSGDVCADRGILFVCNRKCRGIVPNAVFDHWQIFTVAFRNDAGYIQAARRVLTPAGWQWEKRQALGPWAGYTKRERGNPIVTYHVHLILKNVEIIRRANTWSFCCSPTVPVGNAVYDYILSSHVCNVHYNTEQNRVECDNVTLTNIGQDAMPIRGLSVGPHRNISSHSSFKNIRIRGESIGMPLLLRVDAEPLRSDNKVTLKNICAEGLLWQGPHPASNPFGGDRRFASMRRVKPGRNSAWYDFVDVPPCDWRGIAAFVKQFTKTQSGLGRINRKQEMLPES